MASLHRACDTRQGHYIVLVNAGEAPCDPMGRGALAVHPPLPSTGLSIWWRTSGRRQLRRSTHGEAGSCGRNGGERAGRQRVAASTLGKIPGGAGLAVGAASSRRQHGLEQVTRRTKCRRGVGQAARRATLPARRGGFSSGRLSKWLRRSRLALYFIRYTRPHDEDTQIRKYTAKYM